jgi:hypothetical protein
LYRQLIIINNLNNLNKMMLLFLFSVLGLGLLAASFVPIFKQRNAPVKPAFLRVVGVLFLGLAFVTTSLVSIPKQNVGLLYKKWGGVSNNDGIIATNGENGRQGTILSEGMAWYWMVNVNNTVTNQPTTIVPNGMVGLITTTAGEPLSGGEFIAPDWVSPDQAADRDSIETRMLDANYFLTHGGKKGPQLNVLEPGEYKLNSFLYSVELVNATNIEPGYVGVVLSKVGRVPDDIQRKNDGGKLANPVVDEGFRGIHKQVLTPSKYYINTNAYAIYKFNTRVQTWKYAGNYKTAEIHLSINENGEITQERTEQVIAKDKKAADDAMATKTKDGWEVNVNARLLVQIDAADAPYILSSIGNLQELEDKVITPLVRSQVRNQGERSEATDFVTKRSNIESEIETIVIAEALKSRVKVKEFRMTSVAIPPELLVPDKRKQLATKLKITYGEEQKAFHAKVSSEKAKAEAEQQGELVKAQIQKQAATEKRETRRLEGEGERLYQEQIAAGETAMVNVYGKDKSYRLKLVGQISNLPAEALAAPKFYNVSSGNGSNSNGDASPMMGMGMFQTIKMLEDMTDADKNTQPENLVEVKKPVEDTVPVVPTTD